ncbi:acetolactate synthase 2 small subunit [Frischella sp. Ac48]|uniref:Acetolactate synthase 2 small subunit n=1 Tax=Frischella japonica TaxID=2741544 RepID=A0ABR7QVY6_9GAMM|nr:MULTISPECIES: acetolactate synthase 2 small subunit [Frischella]MBC9130216.1 acetolactate synthase 2 small subunit [Frischella japonica]MBX4133200.1 acetolactate synthase 2 small subunit [Frischella sp. Ac48]
MENYELIVKAYDRPGTLERILRVIRHRGGNIQSMNMNVASSQQLLITFKFINSKNKTQIINQLLKLADIVAID